MHCLTWSLWRVFRKTRSNLMSERNGWEHGARKNIVFCSQYNTRRKLPVLLCQNNIFLRVFFVICARTFYIFALGLSPYSTMSSNVHIFNYRLPGLWQNPAKLQLSKLPYLAFHTSSETRTCKESKVQVQRKIAVYLELSKILFCVNILIRQKYVEFYIIAPVNKFTLVPVLSTG